MFVKHFKFVFLPIVLAAFFIPTVSFAVDQRCWTKLACESGDELTRGVFHQSDETKAACQMTDDPITKQPVGFCIAAGTAETKVDFGGKQSFAHIGDFIKWIYKYGVAVAGILAVVMIINAGFGWAISGGSPEKITHSRKRIGEAMMGLFLAVMSYFILNMINPYMVNLRMPQVWMINTNSFDILSEYCANLKSKDQVVEVKGKKDLTKIGDYFAPYKEEIPKDFWQTKYVVFADRVDQTECGKSYLPKSNDSEAGVCKGGKCPESSYCDIGKNKCVENVELTNIAGGGIVGTISWEGDKYGDYIWLKALCVNGDVKDIDSKDLGSSDYKYKFGDVAQKGEQECGGADEINGYFLIIEVNDEDLANTNDDQWVGGVSFCKGVVSPVSCGLAGASTFDAGDVENNLVDAFKETDSLFKHFYIAKGINCNLEFTEKSMPNVGTSILGYAVEGVADAVAYAALGIHVDFGKEIYSMGKGYYCPYITDRYNFFKETLKKKKDALKNKGGS